MYQVVALAHNHGAARDYADEQTARRIFNGMQASTTAHYIALLVLDWGQYRVIDEFTKGW